MEHEAHRRSRKRKLAYLLVAAAAIVFSWRRRREKSTKGTEMHHENKEIVRRFIEEPWKGDVDVLDEIVSTEFVGYDPSMPEAIRGVEGAKDFVRMYTAAFPDGGLTIDESVAEGDRVAARWTGRGTHEGDLMGIAPTGKQVTVSGMSFFRLAGGKIVEERSDWDMFGLLVQLEAAEAPVSA